jgi:hypothetical protein
MKALLTIAFACLAFTSHAHNTKDSTKKTISEGTIVTMKLMQDISSKTANEGDIIEFQLTEPIIVGDRVLVKAGAKITGKVTDSDRAKGLGKAGKLNFTIDYLYADNGKVIKLTTEQKTEGKAKVGGAVAEAVLLTPLFLLKKGKNVKFETGHIFKAFVDKDTEL